jgi:hypothetical protein
MQWACWETVHFAGDCFAIWASPDPTTASATSRSCRSSPTSAVARYRNRPITFVRVIGAGRSRSTRKGGVDDRRAGRSDSPNERGGSLVRLVDLASHKAAGPRNCAERSEMVPRAAHRTDAGATFVRHVRTRATWIHRRADRRRRVANRLGRVTLRDTVGGLPAGQCSRAEQTS